MRRNNLSYEDWQKVRAYVRRVFNGLEEERPRLNASHNASDALLAAEKHFNLPTHGVEGWAVNTRRGVSYLNTGDSYGTTILALCNQNQVRFVVGSWADLVEGDGDYAPNDDF